MSLATIETAASSIGDKLETLLARIASAGIEIGIRERVIAARIVAELAVEAPVGSPVLLRARLTPLLAKSPEDVERIRRIFLDVFDESSADATFRAEPGAGMRIRRALRSKARAGRFYYVMLLGAFTLAIALATGISLYQRLFPPKVSVEPEAPITSTRTPADSAGRKGPTTTTSTDLPVIA